jgi:hypothetical protein
VEEERVKSAFELAMERISGMPELTPEEKAAQKEKEYAPLGTALAVKYMGGMLDSSELPGALARYEGDALHIVRRSLIAGLLGELRLDSTQGQVRRAWTGLEQVAAAKRDVLDSYTKIVTEFEDAKEKSLLEFASAANESLKALGISGSAIRPNLNENEQWKQEVERLRQSFEPKLEQLRQSLR